jgi:carbamoyl-phosphate synthase large subunit
MKSTGEVMGIDSDFGRAFAKAQIQAGNSLPTRGTVLVSMRSGDQESVVEAVRTLVDLDFRVLATNGTAQVLARAGIEAERVNKGYEDSPNTVDRIEAGDVDLVITTVDADDRAVEDSFSMRRAALQRGIPYCTTLAAARASASAIRALRTQSIGVRSLQEIHARM